MRATSPLRLLGPLARATSVILIAVIIGGCDHVGAHPEPSTAGPTGKILFERQSRLGSVSLYTLDLATGSQTAVVATAGRVTAALLSPDHKHIAMTLEEDGAARYALVVSAADGSSPVTIVEHKKAEGTTGPDFVSVAWSPDGSHIAFSGRTPQRGRTVSIVSVAGGPERVLDGHWESVSWSPNGKNLLLRGWPAGGDTSMDLYRARTDGSEVVRLTHDRSYEFGATWSPDATRISFAREKAASRSDSDIWVMNADGSDVHQITSGRSFDGLPVWSSDGTWIAFASNSDEMPSPTTSGEDALRHVSIFAMRPDGSGARRLLDGGTSAAFPLSW